jgi:transcriptional regulator with XRE-family HTH domain
MILLRHLIGDVLRRHRRYQGRTLREVAATARISLGYLSEVERGQKEPSSELLKAICEALGIRMSEVLRDVADALSAFEPAIPESVPETEEVEPVGAGAVRGGSDGSSAFGTDAFDPISRGISASTSGSRLREQVPVGMACGPASGPIPASGVDYLGGVSGLPASPVVLGSVINIAGRGGDPVPA